MRDSMPARRSFAYDESDDPSEVARRLREGPSTPKELREDYEALGDELRGYLDALSQEVQELREEIQELRNEGTDAVKDGSESRRNIWGIKEEIDKRSMDILILTVLLMFLLYDQGHWWGWLCGAFLNAWLFYRLYADTRAHKAAASHKK